MSDESSKSLLRRVLEAVGHSLWTLVAGFGLPGVIMIVLLQLLIGAHLISRPALEDPTWTLVLFACQYILGLGLLLTLPILIRRLSREKLRSLLGIARRPKWNDIQMALGYFALYFIATLLVRALVQVFVPGVDLEQEQNVGFKGVSDVIGLVASFIALIIMAPVAEELIFRGYLFGKLRPLIGTLAGVILTSALFGLVHGQWNVGIDVAVLSIFLCLLRIKTDSIWAGIFLHMTKNSLAYFFLFIAPLLGIRIQ